MDMDISNFYIQNDLEDYQNMRFAMNMIPQDIIDEYNLEEIVHADGYYMYLPLYYHVGVFNLRARRPKYESSFWTSILVDVQVN